MALDRQKVFDAAYTGLRNQGFRRSVSIVGHCRYRGTEGRKCAIGHLISDDHYNPIIEGRGVSAKEIKKAVEEAGFGDYSFIPTKDQTISDRLFLGRLQSAHDSSIEYDGEAEPEVMKGRLHAFAEKWNLTIPE